jgi:hypothetical protein
MLRHTHTRLCTQEPDDAGITPYVIATANGHKEVLKQLDLARQLRIEIIGDRSTTQGHQPTKIDSSVRFGTDSNLT